MSEIIGSTALFAFVPITGCYYYLNDYLTIGSAFSIGSGGFQGHHIVDGREITASWKVSIFYSHEQVFLPLLKEDPELDHVQENKVIQEEEMERRYRAKRNEMRAKQGEPQKAEVVFDKFKDLAIIDAAGVALPGDVSDHYGSILLETFPANCTFTCSDITVDKRKLLCSLIHFEPGTHQISLVWRDQSLTSRFELSAGQQLYVRASFIRQEITVHPLYHDVFISHSDGCIEDIQRNLLWPGKSPDEKFEWFAADEYCRNLSIGTAIDWRLPSLAEIQTIFIPVTVETDVSGDTKDIFMIPPLFSVEHNYLWTSKLGPSSPILVDRPVYYIEPKTGHHSWASPFRKFGLMPVHWADNGAVPALEAVENSYKNRKRGDAGDILPS